MSSTTRFGCIPGIDWSQRGCRDALARTVFAHGHGRTKTRQRMQSAKVKQGPALRKVRRLGLDAVFQSTLTPKCRCLLPGSECEQDDTVRDSSLDCQGLKECTAQLRLSAASRSLRRKRGRHLSWGICEATRPLPGFVRRKQHPQPGF